MVLKSENDTYSEIKEVWPNIVVYYLLYIIFIRKSKCNCQGSSNNLSDEKKPFSPSLCIVVNLSLFGIDIFQSYKLSFYVG